MGQQVKRICFFFCGANLPVIFLELADRSPDLESWLGPNRQSRFGPKKPTALFLMTAASSAVHRRHRKGSLWRLLERWPCCFMYLFYCECVAEIFSKSSPRFWMDFPNRLEKKRPLPNDSERRLHPQRFQHQFPPPKIQVADGRKGTDGARCPMAIGVAPSYPRPAQESTKEGDDVQGVVGTCNNLETYPKWNVVGFSNGVQIPDFRFSLRVSAWLWDETKRLII